MDPNRTWVTSTAEDAPSLMIGFLSITSLTRGSLGLDSLKTRDLYTSTFKGARLDRALCNVDWKLKFEGELVSHLPNLNSDHFPLLVTLDGDGTTSTRASLRFEAAWLTHLNVKEVVRSLWSEQASFGENLHSVAEGLSIWNKECFGNIFLNKRRLWVRIVGV